MKRLEKFLNSLSVTAQILLASLLAITVVLIVTGSAFIAVLSVGLGLVILFKSEPKTPALANARFSAEQLAATEPIRREITAKYKAIAQAHRVEQPTGRLFLNDVRRFHQLRALCATHLRRSERLPHPREAPQARQELIDEYVAVPADVPVPVYARR